jgi:hypothetical protein
MTFSVSVNHSIVETNQCLPSHLFLLTSVVSF